jgi:hypothetical protein
MPIILTLKKQEDPKFKASMGYTATLSLKKKKKERN